MRVTVYTKHQLTLLYKNPGDGSLGVLVVRRREGGREGEVIPRVWENTVATEGMLGNLNPLGDGPGRSLADHGVCQKYWCLLFVLIRQGLRGGVRATGCFTQFFDCWWALFGNRAAENNNEGDSVY